MDVVTNGLHHNVWKNISVKKSDENKSDTDDFILIREIFNIQLQISIV